MRLITEEKELLKKLVDANIKRLNGEVRHHKTPGRNTLAHNKFLKELNVMLSIQIKLER